MTKRRPNNEEKSKLDPKKVPNLTLKAMKKALDNRDVERHDEMYQMLLEQAKKENK